MSALTDSAAAALGIPASLVERSAAARAAVSGTSADDVLSAWSGGAPAAAATAAPAAAAPETAPATAPETAPAAAPETAPTAVAVAEPVIVAPVVQEVIYEEELAEPLEPAPLGERLAVATRVGAWTGAGLGFVAFFVMAAFWAPDTAVVPESGPVAQVSSTSLLVGFALVSVLFGAIVAGLSRAGAAWTNPAMQLKGSKAGTAWLGAVLGLVLGLAGGALISALGTPLETPEETLVQLPILTSLAVLLLGGAILGAITSVVPQIFGTPVAVADSDEAEVAEVKGRLGGAVGIPLAGLLILLVLVIPFGYILIQSNHLASGGAAVVAIIVAAGILGFASLAGSRPEMKITFGDLMVALVGIGTVLVIILAVLLFNSDAEHEDEGGNGGEASVVQLF